MYILNSNELLFEWQPDIDSTSQIYSEVKYICEILNEEIHIPLESISEIKDESVHGSGQLEIMDKSF